MEHPELVTKLRKSGKDIVEQLTNTQADALHMAVGIAGEAGELLDAIKKYAIYQKNPDLENIVEELGDLEFFMEGLRQIFCITREECLDKNIAKLTKRYGETYTNQAAQERKDKQ